MLSYRSWGLRRRLLRSQTRLWSRCRRRWSRRRSPPSLRRRRRWRRRRQRIRRRSLCRSRRRSLCRSRRWSLCRSRRWWSLFRSRRCWSLCRSRRRNLCRRRRWWSLRRPRLHSKRHLLHRFVSDPEHNGVWDFLQQCCALTVQVQGTPSLLGVTEGDYGRGPTPIARLILIFCLCCFCFLFLYYAIVFRSKCNGENAISDSERLPQTHYMFVVASAKLKNAYSLVQLDRNTIGRTKSIHI